jgi:hypothetical protein
LSGAPLSGIAASVTWDEVKTRWWHRLYLVLFVISVIWAAVLVSVGLYAGAATVMIPGLFFGLIPPILLWKGYRLLLFIIFGRLRN